MKQGKWFLCFDVEVKGFNSIGESMGEPIYFTRQIKIHLRGVSNETEATDLAKIIWFKKSFDTIPPEYHGNIKRDDDLAFLNPKIVHEGVDFEKELVVP